MAREIHKLIQKLPEQDWWSRQRTISCLIGHPEKEYIAYLENGIRNHEHADIRNTAMEVYKALGSRALPSLAALLCDNDSEVRLFAANVLCAIEEREALPFLISSVHDRDVNVRAASAEALGRIGDRRAIPVLKEKLHDEEWVAIAAVNALGEIGGGEALELLYDCLCMEGCREMAVSAIEKAGDRDSIRHLVSCFDSPGLRAPALKAIVAIAEREQVRPRPEYLMSLESVLIGMLDSADPEMKRHAFMALCWSTDIMGLPHLIEAVKDDALQEYAIEGLLRIGRRAVCSIADEIKATSGNHRVILAKVLEMIGENKALLQFAEDGDPEVRAVVALALGSVDMERAVRTLRQMLSDPSEEVRLAAGRSLSRMSADRR
ncbi:MAG: HEAT repeat domain-containing protein [Nitrospirae bacterium]|nr:HEAT repeat domain-containing protein [Nitrospirota bacterium]